MGRSRIKIQVILWLVASLIQLAAFAQPDLPQTNRAISFCEANDLMAARNTILEAVQSEKEGNHPYTWYVKGFVFKEIFKQIEKANPYSENREVAVDAILRSLEMDKTDTYVINNHNALRYLAVTFYNDAVLLTRTLDKEKIDEPVLFYERYKGLNSIVEPTKDYTSKDLEFYKNMARACRLIYEKQPEIEPVYFESMERYYFKAMEVDPNDFQSRYNLAVNYYNKGVHEIRKIDHNTEIVELMRIQDECIALFKKALPYMQSANNINPDHLGALKGLMAIHRSLSDDITSAEYREKLESLINDGKPRE